MSADARSSWGLPSTDTDVINGEEEPGEMKPHGGMMPDADISGRIPKVGVRGLRGGSNDGSRDWFSRSKKFIGRNGLGGTDVLRGNCPSFPGV